jgi:hypothetical protein
MHAYDADVQDCLSDVLADREADGVVQAPRPRGQPGQELMHVAAGVGVLAISPATWPVRG